MGPCCGNANFAIGMAVSPTQILDLSFQQLFRLPRQKRMIFASFGTSFQIATFPPDLYLLSRASAP